MSMPRIFAIHVCVVSMAMPLPYEICIRFGLESWSHNLPNDLSAVAWELSHMRHV